MAVRSPHKLTYEEFSQLPDDDGLRYELIDGEVHVTPAPNTRHQDIAGSLFVEFRNHLRIHGGGRVFIAPFEVHFSDAYAVQPDLIFVSDQQAQIITDAKIEGVPTLVAEVLSDPARDRRLKRDRYAEHALPEYWLVDPEADHVEIYRLIDDGYGAPEILRPPQTLTTPALPGLAIDLSELLKR